MAKSEKIAEDQEKALHFPGKDDTFFNSENAYVSRFACTSVNGHRKRGRCVPAFHKGREDPIYTLYLRRTFPMFDQNHVFLGIAPIGW